MIIGERILELCARRKLTVNELAELCDMNQSTVQAIVSRKANSTKVNTLEQICDGLGISLSDFFTEDDDGLSPDAANHLEVYKTFLRQKFPRK